ncbi:YtxH domain-containing protein [Spongiactinospora gelatinilytica]|nr:YtxH domain-containing protein [Spongiactinospora gelatinilytica]
MSLRGKKRHVMATGPQTWQGWMKARAIRAREQVGPMADNARDIANSRIVDARTWAAPRLDQAAHSVEDQIAPRVSAILSEAAKRVDPKPARSRRPLLFLVFGLALGAAGYLMYRRNAQQWSDAMRESAADATQWAGDKAEQAGEKIADKADAASRSADQRAEDISKKLS